MFAALAVAGGAFAQNYTVVNLGVLGGSGVTNANGLSENGKVVGQSNGQAFIWTMGGGMVGLNGLGGATSNACGVNDSGQVVGRADVAGGYNAVLWDNSLNATNLGMAGEFSEAKAINNAGTVTGMKNFRGFRKPYGGASDTLPTLDGITLSNAINATGTVAGGSDDSSDVRHAFRYASGLTLEDFGVQPGGDYSVAQGINDAGMTVGYSSYFTTFRAWMNNGSGFTPLDGLYTYENRAYDINNLGDAVGWSWLSSDGNTSRAVIWRSGNTTAIDLNDHIPGFDSDWELRNALAINDAGQIIGNGRYQGEIRGFLLNPVAVPEPATLAALGLGALGLIKRRRRP